MRDVGLVHPTIDVSAVALDNEKSDPRDVDVLIVDDDETSTRLLTEMLALSDYTSLIAANGADALALLEHVRPQLLLLDIRMPRLNGIELLRRLRGSREYAALPVIFVSGENPNELQDPIARSIPFFRKPINCRELLYRIGTTVVRTAPLAAAAL